MRDGFRRKRYHLEPCREPFDALQVLASARSLSTPHRNPPRVIVEMQSASASRSNRSRSAAGGSVIRAHGEMRDPSLDRPVVLGVRRPTGDRHPPGRPRTRHRGRTRRPRSAPRRYNLRRRYQPWADAADEIVDLEAVLDRAKTLFERHARVGAGSHLDLLIAASARLFGSHAPMWSSPEFPRSSPTYGTSPAAVGSPAQCIGRRVKLRSSFACAPTATSSHGALRRMVGRRPASAIWTGDSSSASPTGVFPW
jgi:hypothetical protein